MALNVAICGALGRMGQALVAAAAPAQVSVVAQVDRTGQGASAIKTLDEALALKPDVVIDFTTPEASLANAAACAAKGVPIVIGTTGLSAEQRDELKRLARSAAIVWAPNMSVGVNVVIALAAQLAKTLGDGWDPEIVETHHRLKKDAPSGTALKLAEEVAAALGRGPADICTSRVGQVGERPATEIGVQTLRGGDVVGEHTVYFFAQGERIELTHRAHSREQFARGALRAAKWVVGRPPGLYDMRAVLGF